VRHVRRFSDAVAPALPLRNPRTGATRQQAGQGEALPPQPVWLGPQIRNGVLFHDVTMPLNVGGHTVGRITASLGGASINRLVASFSRNIGTTAFLLNSENRVIAYSADPSLMSGRSGIALAEMPDPALREFPKGELVNELDQSAGNNAPIKVHSVDTDLLGFVFLTREIVMLSPEPYTVGAYFTDTDVMVELQRAARSGFAGLVALALALLIAFFLARSISRPLDRVADAARRFSELDLDGFSPLPASQIREIDTQAGAFNALHTGLTQFSRYVPQVLVRRILESGPDATRPVEREITVMFADIADFTALSEPMDAEAIVGLLNEVFAIISGEVVATSGTVDKYLGDGVMAFWGAPEEDVRHAANAVLAATRIRKALEVFNRARVDARKPPIRFRVGLHTGRATVGTIGGADRANYTILGHTVNVASRIEQLIKSLDCGDDVCIAISRRCHHAAGSPAGFQSVGLHEIRGSTEPLEVLAAVSSDNAHEHGEIPRSAPMAN
jgi:adenylate cyclase